MKKRISIYLDDDVIEYFRSRRPGGKGYQTAINSALRTYTESFRLEQIVRDAVREVVFHR